MLTFLDIFLFSILYSVKYPRKNKSLGESNDK